MIAMLSDIKSFELPSRGGNLFFAENTQLPLNIKRFFIIKAQSNEKRGHHAHKQLSQYLLCVHGACEVICDDGKNKKTFLLDSPEKALLIPPGIWAEQTYLRKDTTLIVACDAAYDESDYLRDYELFLQYRAESL